MFEGTSCINDPIIISPDLAFRAEATTGEGSIWHPDRNTLFWVDIEGKTLYEYIPDLQTAVHGSSTAWSLPSYRKRTVR